MWQKYKCDKTQKLKIWREKSTAQNVTVQKPKMWQKSKTQNMKKRNSKTQNVTILKKI